MAGRNVIHPGPMVSDLLLHQSVHISQHIWNGGEERVLRARRARAVKSIPKEIEPFLKQAGFYEAALVKDVATDHNLIKALVERWRSETHTFHMPVGECTITLQDVALQLGLKIDGKPVTGETNHDSQTLVYENLGKDPGPAGPKANVSGGRLKLSWLSSEFSSVEEHLREQQPLVCFARAYMLRLIGGFLLLESDSGYVPVRYLSLLTNFDETKTYSWGSAILAHLYRQLCSATNVNCKQINGCNVLLQFWAWSRFVDIGPSDNIVVVRGSPLGGRWVEAPTYHEYPLSWYRAKFDNLTKYDFVWNLYPATLIRQLPRQCVEDHRLWRAVVPMILYHVVEWHQPDRVLHQFGLQQHIPARPLQQDELHHVTLKGKTDLRWVEMMEYFVAVWDNRHEQVCEQQELETEPGPSDEYMRWYLQRTRRLITPPDDPSPETSGYKLLADKLHRMYAMSTTEGRARGFTDHDIQAEIMQCLTICKERDRVVILAAAAPEPTLVVTRPLPEHIPKVGRKEGKDALKRRPCIPYKEHSIPVVDHSSGIFYVPPQFPGSEGLSYTHTSTEQQSEHDLGGSSEQHDVGGASFQQDFGGPSFQQDVGGASFQQGFGGPSFQQGFGGSDDVDVSSIQQNAPWGLDSSFNFHQSTPSIFQSPDVPTQDPEVVTQYGYPTTQHSPDFLQRLTMSSPGPDAPERPLRVDDMWAGNSPSGGVFHYGDVDRGRQEALQLGLWLTMAGTSQDQTPAPERAPERGADGGQVRRGYVREARNRRPPCGT